MFLNVWRRQFSEIVSGAALRALTGEIAKGFKKKQKLDWRVEAVMADYFVTPIAEFRPEDQETGPMP